MSHEVSFHRRGRVSFVFKTFLGGHVCQISLTTRRGRERDKGCRESGMRVYISEWGAITGQIFGLSWDRDTVRVRARARVESEWC